MDASVRRAAAQALGQLGRADDAVRTSAATWPRDQKVNASVRSAAAQALGQLGRTDDAVRCLGLLLLAQDQKVDAYTRSAAAQALGQLGRADDVVLSGLLLLAQDQQRWLLPSCRVVYNSLKALLWKDEEGNR